LRTSLGVRSARSWNRSAKIEPLRFQSRFRARAIRTSSTRIPIESAGRP